MPRKIYGMVHLSPLPGTPFYEPESFDAIQARAVASARALHEAGVTGCLIQTVDRAYAADDRSDPARIAAMACIVRAIVEATGPTFAVGVQMMRNDIASSLAVAKVAGGAFVRATALVGETPTDRGLIRADPYAVAAYRRAIQACSVGITADIASIHHRDQEGIGQLARRALRVGADAVSVGYRSVPRTLEAVAEVRAAAPGLPVILSGHTNHNNAAELLRAADGAFVGSCLEPEGWGTGIDKGCAVAYMDVIRALPKTTVLPSNP